MQFSILWNGWAFFIIKIVYVKNTCNKPLYICLSIVQRKKEEKLNNKNQMKTKLHNQNVYIKQKRNITVYYIKTSHCIKLYTFVKCLIVASFLFFFLLPTTFVSSVWSYHCSFGTQLHRSCLYVEISHEGFSWDALISDIFMEINMNFLNKIVSSLHTRQQSVRFNAFFFS